MHEEFVKNQNTDQKLAHVLEETGEALSALGKCYRFGFYSTNPLTGDPETNIEWLERELVDVSRAIDRILPELRSQIERKRNVS